MGARGKIQEKRHCCLLPADPDQYRSPVASDPAPGRIFTNHTAPAMTLTFLLTLTGCFLFAVYGVLIGYYRRAWKAIPVFSAGPRGDGPGAPPRTALFAVLSGRA